MKPLHLSLADARRFLVFHHFEPATLHGALMRLGSVQFDPLKPVGRNHDLVLQARVEHYRVDDWEALAYQERFLIDAWDKQASLVLMQDWPQRRIYHAWHESRWRERVLETFPAAIAAVLDELHERGPLTSAAFHFQEHKEEWRGSWYGPRLTKNVLRALWHTGRVLTHSRKNGHHVYDIAERIVPPALYTAPPLSEQDSTEWLITRRHQATGLLRPHASSEVWSLGIPAPQRHALLRDMARRGMLLPVEIDGIRFHALPNILERLDIITVPERMMFLAPLDQLLWDRRAIAHLFAFDYTWEVYKPAAERKWGYYVLPVLYRDRFVARCDSRQKGAVWEVFRWYWEADVTPDHAMLTALEQAVRRFKRYLGVDKIKLPRGLDARTRAAWQAGARE